MLERNECSCNKCKLFCKVMPSFLLPEDLIPYMEATGFVPVEDAMEGEDDSVSITLDQIFPWAVDNLLASDGAIVRIPDTNGMVRVPTLVPNNRKNGSCVHYNQKSGLCAVHKSAPFGCRFFSCSMKERDAIELSTSSCKRLGHMWFKLEDDPDELSMIEGMYAAIWLELSEKGHKRSRTTMALRKRFERRLKEIERNE